MTRTCVALLTMMIVAFPACAWANTPTTPSSEISPQPGEAPLVPASFDGVWSGVIHFDKEGFLTDTGTPAVGTAMRIEIHGPVVRVFMEDSGSFGEIMPGSFIIAPVMANAVIFGTHFSAPWTESWSFVITHKDDNTLLVNFTRVVNNQGTPLSDPDSKFSTRGVGEFKRVDR